MQFSCLLSWSETESDPFEQQEAINLLNVAVAEKIQEFGQRSMHCIEGYLLFAQAIISYLQADSKGGEMRVFENERLEHVPVWSSSSSTASEDNSVGEDEDGVNEARYPEPAENQDANADMNEGGSAARLCTKPVEECPERDLWRLLRRSEEILKAELSLPQVNQTGSYAAVQLNKVRDLLRWFDVSKGLHGVSISNGARPSSQA